MSDHPDGYGIELFPVTIGKYATKNHLPLAVDGQVWQIMEVLAEFGPTLVPWPVNMRRRGSDAVDKRLWKWASAPPDGRFRNTLLYWAGHGWSNGADAALAHFRSPHPVESSGLLPSVLAATLTARESRLGNDSWAIVVIDACQSKRFVQLLSAHLDRVQGGARRVMLVATSDVGATTLGVVTEVLRECLEIHFAADPRVELWALAKQLGIRLSLVTPRSGIYEAELVRLPPFAIPLELDARDELKEILDALPPDERRHYIARAQGAEVGESLWFFEGREAERQAVVDWSTNDRRTTSSQSRFFSPAPLWIPSSLASPPRSTWVSRRPRTSRLVSTGCCAASRAAQHR